MERVSALACIMCINNVLMEGKDAKEARRVDGMSEISTGTKELLFLTKTRAENDQQQNRLKKELALRIDLVSSRFMVSGALGKISRRCPRSDGPSDDSFHLILLSPLWCPLLWYSGQLPQSPTP